MPSVIRTFQVNGGVIAGERLATEPDELYATPQELGAMFGVRCSEAQIRHAMSIIHSVTNRPSLWPVEYEFPTLRMPPDRYEGRIPITPVIRIVDATWRYAYGFRRDRQSMNALTYGAAALLVLAGGMAPRFVPINPDTIQVDGSTGIFTLSTGLFLMPFTELRLRCIAGYLEIPGRVKMCLVELINNVSNMGMSSRIAYSVGRISRKYASTSFVNDEVLRLLQPFIVTSLM